MPPVRPGIDRSVGNGCRAQHPGADLLAGQVNRRDVLKLAGAALLPLPGFAAAGAPTLGATVPWETYQARSLKTNGTVLGPVYEPFRVEMESSGQACVKLASPGEYVEFIARSS